MGSSISTYYGGTTLDETTSSLPNTLGAAPDQSSSPIYSTVLSNSQLAQLDLPGQLDSFPGGASTPGMYPGGSADPSGINSVHLSPTVNPTPTGGYMSVAAAIAAAASTGFSTYAKGSPSVATPPPMYPGGSMTSGMLTGQTNWLVVGAVVAVGVALLGWLAFKV
jgi:hypothetical protein